ncbi:hypothetical protein [Haloarcula rubripromontorii]|uniref:Uncharacterized protein n=1 Tax=Haloarcula rubripromontorii TaxID=1705562 RepID=A0A847U4C0_9EURY|nr:hypothetical protein [Haloarcula rubripromontorii]NLV07829.1 hypothetical protein [Haloarcula rubripromontorii]
MPLPDPVQFYECGSAPANSVVPLVAVRLLTFGQLRLSYRYAYWEG